MLETLIPFVGASILIVVAPGPSTVVILRESVTSGRRAGIAAVLGNKTGVLVSSRHRPGPAARRSLPGGAG